MTRIVITGMGCLTPLGNNVADTWTSLIAGRSGINNITRFDPSMLVTRIGGEVKNFDPAQYFGAKEARRMDRFCQLAVAAAVEAMQDSNYQVTEANTFQTSVVISSGFGGSETLQESFDILRTQGYSRLKPTAFPMVLPNMAAAMTAMRFGIRGVNFNMSAACATSAVSIGEGAEIIKRGDADVALVGGTEASFAPFLMAGLDAIRATSTRNDSPQTASRPFDATRDGFVPSEGAGVLVLERLEHAQQRGARIYAELVGYGCTCDAWHVTAPESTGIAMARAMQNALDKAGLNAEDIDYINAHGTATRLNDSQETRVIKQVFGELAYRIPISSTKSMTGHAMSSSGAFEAIFSVLAIRDGIIPPTTNLNQPDPECDLDYVPHTARSQPLTHVMSNSFGFGGQNAVLIFKKFTE